MDILIGKKVVMADGVYPITGFANGGYVTLDGHANIQFGRVKAAILYEDSEVDGENWNAEKIMREIHRWGAHLMVITVWLHMFRVFMTGSYKPPREFNWAIGVILLVLTMLMSFTGYLLPWDQY